MSRDGHRCRAVAVLVAVFLAASCGSPALESPSDETGMPRLGVLSPSAAETLARVGASEAIVAVGDWVTWPPEIAERPALGSFEAPSAERVLALDLDALVTVESVAGRRELAEIAALGVEVVALDTSTLDGTLASIDRLGQLVSRRREAMAMVDEIRTRLDELAARAAGAAPRSVLVVVGREPLYVAGPGSHFDELVRLAGGDNVASDLGAPYGGLSLEAALARRPEVILDVSENLPGAPRGRRTGDWASWPFLPAVAEERVHFVDPSRLAIPGPRLPEMAELVARIVRPELFGEPAAEDYLSLAEVARR